MQRLERKGKGILLLHDIQPRTVEALPRILRELKVRGYRIVHVVPATPDRPATPTEPQQWLLHPPSETVATSRWPKVPKFAFAGPTLPVPALSDLDWHTTDLGVRASRRGRGVPLPPVAPWPRQTTLPPAGTLAALPVPARSIFKIPESARHDPAGRVRAPGGIDCTGAFNGSLLGKARRQISPRRPRSRGPAAGVRRRGRAGSAKRRRDRAQAGGTSQTEWAIGSGRRVEEALIGRF